MLNFSIAWRHINLSFKKGTSDTSMTLIDVALTINESFIAYLGSCQSLLSGGHTKTQSSEASSVIFTRSYRNYNSGLFLSDLECVPFHIIDIFDDFDDQVDVFNTLFLGTLKEHSPIKRIKIKSHPNPTPEIKQLM